MVTLSISALAVQNLFDTCIRIVPDYQSKTQPDESTSPGAGLHESLKDAHSRFKVWCGNLGGFQWGHASLDWRLREASQIRTQIVNLLEHMTDDLENCLEILSKRRPPLDFDSDDSDSDGLETSFSGSELDVRLQSISNVVQNLYRVAFVIRNQKTRRSTTNKIRHHERRDSQTGLDLFEDGYRPFDRHHVLQILSDMRRTNSPAATESEGQYKVLVDRLTAANILRRKQFSHWERHAWKLQQAMNPQLTDSNERKSIPARPVSEVMRSGEKAKQASVLSPTEVTKTHREPVLTGLETDIETQSTASFASTIKDVEGHEASLPDPPRTAQEGRAFECPYCFVLCPPKEASRRRWRKHILEDLRPYLCIYPECTAGDHLFGSRSELLNHEEMLHRRVWKCREHPTEPYKSESDFRTHLKSKHKDIDEETAEALVEFSSTAAEDDRKHCPLCLRATESIPPGQTLFKHIANHLETLATFSVPRNVNLADDNERGGSNDPVQADDNDERSWESDVFSEWSDDEEVADANGVKMSLEQFPRQDLDSTDAVNEYLTRIQSLQHNDTARIPLSGKTLKAQELRRQQKNPSDMPVDGADSANSITNEELPSIREHRKLEAQHSDALYRAVERIELNWLNYKRERRPQRPTSPAAPDKLLSTTTLPKFLNQSKSELHNKFVDLEWQQRNRLLQGQSDPKSWWARLSGDHITARNRYLNVEPYSNNRVILRVGEDGNNYINASPILLGERGYIAAQGPTETTVNHFWRMIAEMKRREPVVVVMLTQTHEAGNEKCFQYFPLTTDDSPMPISPDKVAADGFHGQIVLGSVRHLEETGIDIRDMILESRLSPSEPWHHLQVWHLSFSSWPDFLIPEGDDRTDLVKLIRLSNTLTWEFDEKSAEEAIASLHKTGVMELASMLPRSTRVIHCSAGVGRTGTFIALDHLLFLLEAGKLDDIPDDRDPVVETVDQIRQQRMMMVQGEPQFNFIYDVLREEWERLAASEERAQIIAEYEQHSQKAHEERKAEEERFRDEVQQVMRELEHTDVLSEQNQKTIEEQKKRSGELGRSLEDSMKQLNRLIYTQAQIEAIAKDQNEVKGVEDGGR